MNETPEAQSETPEAAPAEPEVQEAPAAEPAAAPNFKDALRDDINQMAKKGKIAESDVESAFDAIGAALMDGLVMSDNEIQAIKQVQAHIDRKLNEQIDQILHHPEFQKVESTWRGVHHLVYNSPAVDDIEIRVMNIAKEDLSKTISHYPGETWMESPLFRAIHQDRFNMHGGEPFGCIVGDYYFDHGAGDVKTLSGIAQMCAASHAPFLTAPKPELCGLDSWTKVPDVASMSRVFKQPDRAAWQAFRENPDSKYVGMMLPRVLARGPYSPDGDAPVDEFEYKEDTSGADHSSFCWMNAAYAMALNINKAFADHGWCTQIRGVQSGGLVEDLPVYTFPTDSGEVAMKCPTEVAISFDKETEFGKLGFIPLLHEVKTNKAAFFGGQSVHQPQKFEGPDGDFATRNAELAARLPYTFAAARFAHFLKKITYLKVGKPTTKEKLGNELQEWINQYVTPNPDSASDEEMARKPLSAAEVEVQEDERNPGYYRATFRITPIYQLEGVDISLRLVSLPTEQ